MQVEKREHVGDLRALTAPRRKDLRDEVLLLARVLVDPTVIDAWCPHLDHPRARRHLPRLRLAVSYDEAVALVIELICVPLDVLGNLGLESDRQHVSGAVAADLVQHGTGVLADVLVGQ